MAKNDFVVVRIPAERLSVDPFQYKPFSNSLAPESGKILVEFRVPKEYVIEASKGVVVLTPEGWAWLAGCVGKAWNRLNPVVLPAEKFKYK